MAESLREALTDDEGLRNAYFDGPHEGPDGGFHLAWVWRESPDAATNHALSDARSSNLRILKKPIPLGERLFRVCLVEIDQLAAGVTTFTRRESWSNFTRPSTSANSVWSRPIPTPRPGCTLVPR